MELAKSFIILGIAIIAILCLAMLITALFIWADRQDEKHGIRRCHSCNHFVPRLFGGYCYLHSERKDSEHIACKDFYDE